MPAHANPMVSIVVAIPVCIVSGPFISLSLIANNKYSTLSKVYLNFSASIIALVIQSQYRINSRLFILGVLSVTVLTPIISKFIQNSSADEEVKQTASFIEKSATLACIIANSAASVCLVNMILGASASYVVGLSLCALTVKVLSQPQQPG